MTGCENATLIIRCNCNNATLLFFVGKGILIRGANIEFFDLVVF